MRSRDRGGQFVLAKTRWLFTASVLAVVLCLFISSASQAETTVLEGNVTTKVEQVEIEHAGPYVVEVAEGLRIRDSSEGGRAIGVEVCYPKSGENFPVIVFSHGALASARDYRPIAAFWASHGYVCVLPTHKDALTLNLSKNGKTNVFRLAKLATVTDSTIADRQSDLTKTLDSLPAFASRLASLNHKMDTNNIALVGHHAGAYAVETACGAAIGKTNPGKSSDVRVKALIAITGKDWHQPQISSTNLDEIKLPLMLVSISPDGSDLSKSRQRLAEAIEAAPAPSKYMVTVDPMEKMSRPSLATVRKALKGSNVEIMPFHPFRRLRAGKRQDVSNKNVVADRTDEQVNLTGIDSNELFGTNLMRTLGMESLFPKSGDGNKRLNFVMSLTLPFLDGHLKGDTGALERLSQCDEQSYEGKMIAKVQRY